MGKRSTKERRGEGWGEDERNGLEEEEEENVSRSPSSVYTPEMADHSHRVLLWLPPSQPGDKPDYTHHSCGHKGDLFK